MGGNQCDKTVASIYIKLNRKKKKKNQDGVLGGGLKKGQEKTRLARCPRLNPEPFTVCMCVPVAASHYILVFLTSTHEIQLSVSGRGTKQLQQTAVKH